MLEKPSDSKNGPSTVRTVKLLYFLCLGTAVSLMRVHTKNPTLKIKPVKDKTQTLMRNVFDIDLEML